MTMLGGNIRSNRRRDGAAAPRKMLITWAGVKLWTPPPPDAIQMRCLNLRKRGLDAQLSTLRSDLLVSTPTDARPFILTSIPAVLYPAPGAARVDVFSYTVPAGFMAFILKLAVINISGGFTDFSGNIVWRCLVNGAGVKGLENLTAQVGTLAAPLAGAVIALMERDIFEITVEVPAGQPPMPLTATSAGEIVGFLYPLPRCTER